MKPIVYIRKIIVRTKKRFDDIGYEWLEQKKWQIKQSSYYNYKFIVERYLIPYYGEKDIRKLHDFNTFIDEISTDLAPKTTRDIYSVLKMILTYYEETYNKKLKYKRTILPKLEKKEIEIFTSKEREKIEKYCIKQDTLKSIGVIICLNTGMRLGEICALRWKNIDLTEKCFYIRETAQRVYKGKNEKSQVIIGLPKTKCSIRTVPINNKLYGILKSLKNKYNEESFFLTGIGKCIEPRNYQDYFKILLSNIKVKKRNFHALRHTMASNCIEIGMDIKTLSRILRSF